MRRLLIITMLIMFFCLIGCATGPSVCDSIAPGDSVLCDAVAGEEYQLEDIGNALIIANALAIGEEIYTREEAIEVCQELIELLNSPITYAKFKLGVDEELSDYPGLKDVVDLYTSDSVIDSDMYIIDRGIIIDWLTERIAEMEE